MKEKTKGRVLITGVAGFIGSNLARRLLDEGYYVIGIDDCSAGTLANVDRRVDFHQLSISDPAAYPLYKGVDVVYHMAARTVLYDCIQKPVETANINVVGTVHVLEAVRQARVRRMIFSDTASEYEGINEFPCRPDKVCPIGTYSASKRAACVFCESYIALHGLDITFVRYFNVYGPAQDWRRVLPPVMTAFIMKALKGERPVIYGSGKKRRDFIYIDDVNELHLILMNAEKTTGKVFNIGTGVNYSIQEIFDLIDGILNTGLEPIYKEDLPGEAEITLADISEARALGWKPKVSIEEGLRESIKYLKSVMGV